MKKFALALIAGLASQQVLDLKFRNLTVSRIRVSIQNLSRISTGM